MKGAPGGTVIVAVTQTGGRGRKDHTFFSPKGGLYMSVILPPELLYGKDSKAVTSFVGSAVVGAIKELTGIEPYIEGINDLYVNGKKVYNSLLTLSFSLSFPLEGGGEYVRPY